MSNKVHFIWGISTWLAVFASAYCIYTALLEGAHASHRGVDHRYFCVLILILAAIYQRCYKTLPVMMKLAVAYACIGMIYGLYELSQLI